MRNKLASKCPANNKVPTLLPCNDEVNVHLETDTRRDPLCSQ